MSSTREQILSKVGHIDHDTSTLQQYLRGTCDGDLSYEDAMDCLHYDGEMDELSREEEDAMRLKGFCKCSECNDFFPKGKYKGKHFICSHCREEIRHLKH